MEIALNHVILSGVSDGTRQRDLNVLGALDAEIAKRSHRLRIYLASDICQSLLDVIHDTARHSAILFSPVPSRPTHSRILKGHFYWKKEMEKNPCDGFHQSYFPVPDTSIRTVVTINDLRFKTFPETYTLKRRLFLDFTIRRAVRRADLIFTISEFTKHEVCEFYSVPADRVVVTRIPYNRNFTRITDSNRLRSVSEQYNLRPPFLLCVGHLEPRKNYGRILAAFKRLNQSQATDASLVIVGRPNLKWKQLLHNTALSEYRDNIMFTGYVPDMDLPALYSLATALVFPSLHEGFGIPLLEAMACGLPVITSNTTGLIEVAESAAILVNPFSTDEIAAAMDTVLSSKRIRENLARKGFARLNAFTPELAATALVDGYERLVSE